jgi:hypothetical protein
MARTELFVRKQPGGVYTIADLDRHPGDIYFVSSLTGTNGAGYGQNPDAPAATLAYALANLVTAGQGDVVYVLPGHVEDIAGAAGIALSKSGVTVIGLGSGSLRPTFTWKTSTAATWTITAANCTIRNIRCTSTIAGLVKLFSITAAGATFDTVDYYEDGATDALQFILTTAAATDLTIKNCSWFRGTTARARCRSGSS